MASKRWPRRDGLEPEGGGEFQHCVDRAAWQDRDRPLGHRRCSLLCSTAHPPAPMPGRIIHAPPPRGVPMRVPAHDGSRAGYAGGRAGAAIAALLTLAMTFSGLSARPARAQAVPEADARAVWALAATKAARTAAA